MTPGRTAVGLLLAGCGPGDGAVSPCAASPASPTSIDEVVALIDTLPAPVTVPCVLAALERPLGLELTTGRFSAQPAFSGRSPRVFVLLDGVTLSVVPEGSPSLPGHESSVEVSTGIPAASSVR